MLAAVVAATGTKPELAGKPYGPMQDLVLAMASAGTGDAKIDLEMNKCVMVGDRPDTDGRFARALGWRWSLVLSGLISANDLPVEPEPDTVHDDLLSCVQEYLR